MSELCRHIPSTVYRGMNEIEVFIMIVNRVSILLSAYSKGSSEIYPLQQVPRSRTNHFPGRKVDLIDSWEYRLRLFLVLYARSGSRFIYKIIPVPIS